MDFHEIVETRRSIRRYQPDRVSDEAIQKLIDAARHGPSADNIQPWEFVVVRDKQVKEKLFILTAMDSTYDRKFPRQYCVNSATSAANSASENITVGFYALMSMP